MSKEEITRRTLFRNAFISAVGAMGTGEVLAGACLAPPDCTKVCQFGGNPKGNGTQECNCFPAARRTPSSFANSGSYTMLSNKPPRAAATTDGGDANNAIKLNGYTLQNAQNNAATNVAVVSGSNIDYMTKAEIASKGIPTVGATTYSAGNSESYVQVNVSRDECGWVNGLSLSTSLCNCSNCCNCCDCSYCNCNCCNCGDDTGCFIQARLHTERGIVGVEDIQVGDVLIGIDGKHRVLGIAMNKVGSRFGISPDGETLLTQEHVILRNGMPVIFDEKFKGANHEIIRSEDGVSGIYAFDGFDDVVRQDRDAFNVVHVDENGRTYTFIVDVGGWVMTESGRNVLLAQSKS